jgi:hypothetical protein
VFDFGVNGTVDSDGFDLFQLQKLLDLVQNFGVVSKNEKFDVVFDDRLQIFQDAFYFRQTSQSIALAEAC